MAKPIKKPASSKTAAKPKAQRKSRAKYRPDMEMPKTAMMVVPQQEVQKFGDFLSEREELIAKMLAGGKKISELLNLFNATEGEIESMQANPTFVKFYQERVMSRGMADKHYRIASEKRIASALDDEIARRLSDPENTELAKTQLNNLLRMRHESFASIKELMGESNDQKNQNTLVLIMESVRKNSNFKIDDINSFNPADEYPVIDVMAEEIQKSPAKEETK